MQPRRRVLETNAPGAEGGSHPKTENGVCFLDVWLLEPVSAMHAHCATLTLHALV